MGLEEMNVLINSGCKSVVINYESCGVYFHYLEKGGREFSSFTLSELEFSSASKLRFKNGC